MNIANRRLVVAAITLTVFATILLVIPAVIKYQVRQWLLMNGGDQVSVHNVDFNPFNGTLYLEGLDVKVDAQTTLSFTSAALDLAWLPLLKKQITIQEVALTGFHALIDNTDILRVGGIQTGSGAQTETAADSGTSAWLVGVNSLTLNDFHILYQDAAITTDLVIDSLRLEDLAQWQPEAAAHLEFVGSINGAAAVLNAELAPLAQRPVISGTLSLDALSLAEFNELVVTSIGEMEGSITLDSEFEVQFPEGEFSLTHSGRLQLAQFALSSISGLVESQSFDLQGDFRIQQSATETQASHNGKLELQQTKLNADAGFVDNTALRWHGKTELQLTGAEQRLSVQTDGELTIDDTSTGSEQVDLYIQFAQFFHSGSFAYADADPRATVMLTTDVVLKDLQASAEQRNYQLLSLGGLQLEGVELQGTDRFAMAGIVLEELYLAKPADSGASGESPLEAFLHIASATINKPALADGQLTIDSVEYQGWQSRLYRDPEGQWSAARLVDVINRLAGDPSGNEDEALLGAGEAGTEEAPAAEALRYLVSRMETVGEDNRLVVVDESVTPTIAVTVDLQRLVIEDVDTADTDTPWRLDLQAGIGKHTQISTEGEFKPLTEPPAVNMTAKLTALDLPWLSSYTRDSLGLLLKSGTLDAELSIETLDSEVTGAADLRLHQLAVESLPGENTLQSSIPVPLNTALSTLRDKNNTIQLEIPISGDISDPSFDVKDALTQALAKGVQKGALSYLTFALQPYGSLIAAAKIAGEAATRVSLNPVFFEAGQTHLTDESLDYLGKVAEVLDDRPNITVKLCGVAAAADRAYFEQQRQASSADAGDVAGSEPAADPGTDADADAQALTQIAEQRAAVVKDYLVEEFGVSPSRLVGCLTRLELSDPDSMPRTDLLL